VAAALAAVSLAAIILAAAARRVIPTVGRTLVGRVVISIDRMVRSSSEVVSTTHSGDRFTRMGMDIRTGMDTPMNIQAGRTSIRRRSRGA
jgi:hypothetical protein